MPQHDPDDEDFWTRSRRTRQSDKASRRGRKPKEGGGKAAADWTEPAPPPSAPAPPPKPPRREAGGPPPRRRSEAPPPAPSPRRAAPQPPAPARGAPRPGRTESYPADDPPAPARRSSRSSRSEPPPADVPPAPARGTSRSSRSEPFPAETPPSRRSGTVEPPPAGRAGASDAPSRRNAAARGDIGPRTGRDPIAGPAPTPGRSDTSRPPGAARRSSRGTTGETPVPASTTNGPHLSGRSAPGPGADPGWTSPTPLTPSPAPERRASARQQAPTRAGGGRTGVRTTGENPHLDDRLEGLASRANTPPGATRVPTGRPPIDEPLAPDPLVDQRATQALPVYEKGYEDDAYGGELYEDSYSDDYDDGGYDAPTPDRSWRPGCVRSPGMIAVAALALLVIVLLFGAFWVKRQIDPGGEPGPNVRVEIVAGQSTSEIGNTLEEAGVIESSTVWTWYIRLKGGGDIQAGVYDIPTNLSMGDALKALEAEPLPPGTKAATIPEGLTVLQMKQRLTESDNKVDGFTPEGWDAAVADPAVRSKYLPADQQSLEGTFFPANYELAEDATEMTLLTKMRAEFDATMDELGVNAGAAALQRQPYEILIVASIIEEEARVPEDRAKIARVIYNRLANGTPLYIDAVNCYDLNPAPCRPADVDFEKDSPYNTRKVQGLPPTPISSPGKASIEAALHPADGDWTYYVLDPQLPEGQHFFTSSQAEFNAAKARCEEADLGCG